MEIYRLIAGVPTPLAGDNAHAIPAPQQGSPTNESTTDTIRRVYRESQPPLQRFLDLLADHPDEWVTTDRVLAATGLTTRQWPQQLSALARRGKKRYAHPGGWPFRSEKLYEAATKRQVWRYSMPGEYAEVIRSLGR